MEKISLALVALQILLIMAFWRVLPPEVPLLYSRPWGKEQLIRPAGLFLIPCFSFLFLLINLAIYRLISTEERLLQKILVSATTLFNLLGIISLIQIIRLII